MEIRYSDHLQLRLKMRGIPDKLPRQVYLSARRRFVDTQTQLEVAVQRTVLHGKQRDVAVIYREHLSFIMIITVHALKAGQIKNRIQSGRWKVLV